MNMYLKNKKGFTLIELLVVVAIISLLSSVAMASLSSARVKARDAKRVQDLHSIKTALELYFNDNGRYPIVSGWASSFNTTTWDALATTLSPYISSLPKDPINNSATPWANNSYGYAYGVNTSSYPGKYDLVTQFEDKSNRNRCALRQWKYHTAGAEASWCGSYSGDLYADH